MDVMEPAIAGRRCICARVRVLSFLRRSSLFSIFDFSAEEFLVSRNPGDIRY